MNQWVQKGSLSKEDAGCFCQLLAPFAPYLTEEIWHEVLGKKSSVHLEPWPKYDPKLVKEKKVVMVVQVNGKVRGQVEIEAKASTSQAAIEKLAKAEKNVTKHLRGKRVKKTIFVPGKLINFVV